MYQQNNSFVYIHIGFMVYVEEKVRKCAFKGIVKVKTNISTPRE